MSEREDSSFFGKDPSNFINLFLVHENSSDILPVQSVTQEAQLKKLEFNEIPEQSNQNTGNNIDEFFNLSESNDF